LWHVGQIVKQQLWNKTETTAITRQQIRKYTTVLESLLGSGLLATMEVLLPLWSAPRLYHSAIKFEWSVLVGEHSARELLGFGHCGPLLLEAGSWGWEQLGNLEARERLQLEATAKQRLWRRDCGH
jgi:hypothetical protein